MKSPSNSFELQAQLKWFKRGGWMILNLSLIEICLKDAFLFVIFRNLISSINFYFLISHLVDNVLTCKFYHH